MMKDSFQNATFEQPKPAMFSQFGVLNQPTTTNILCLSVFDINCSGAPAFFHRLCGDVQITKNCQVSSLTQRSGDAANGRLDSKLLLRKMRGLPDFGFLGSLSLEHRRQEVKPGSKHRFD